MENFQSADSRTASFGKKRQLHPSNLNIQTQPSSDEGSTSMKRSRHDDRTEEQALKDFVSSGVGLVTSVDALNGDDIMGSDAVSGRPSDAAEVGITSAASDGINSAGLAPSINWNAGSKATIRTTLGGARGSGSTSSRTVSKGRGQTSNTWSKGIPATVQVEENMDVVTIDSESEEEGDHGEDEDEDEEHVDALMNYSLSDPIEITDGRSQSSPDRPKVLADLSDYDLRMQIRYTALTKQAHEIDMNQFVKCLVCAQTGHMGKDCPALTCRTCGAYKKHFTHACPQSRKCRKCREPGHAKEDCPYKLPRIVASEIICDLCQQQGHTEDKCEMLWRTFNFTDHSRPSVRIRMACYSCGSSNHFGNDCPSREPGKRIWSSTWSTKGPGGRKGEYLSSVEYSIKGRAGQSEVALDAGSEDDLANFHRPKITRAPRGHIRIAGKDIGRRGGKSWAPVDQPYNDRQPRRDSRYSPPPGYRDRDDYRKPDSYHARGRQQSFSPQPQYPQRVVARNGGDRWQPPLPPEPVPSRRGRGGRTGRGGGDGYRPMPSAAKSAWVKHRT